VAIRLDVRRLAAIDMWGSAGARWRRWVILAEFVFGVFGVGALGLTLVSSADGAAGALIGLWFVGVAANYAPLSLYALAFVRRGALEAEIEGVDVFGELRHYTTAQLWVAVPLLLVVVAAVQHTRGGGRTNIS
jgi:hypothetical protein